ncbi:unnamed protein product [Withania somnifera]
MLMWSYIKVVIQDPGFVPENWKLVSEQNIEDGNSVALSDYASIENSTPALSTDQTERRQSQYRGYCSKCQNGKPPRCHHCSVFLNLAFSLSLLCFVIMHASLLSSNTTSVEWKYDLGWKRNFEQVFGANKALWFFPLFSKKDLENIPALHGMEFPTRSDAVE